MTNTAPMAVIIGGGISGLAIALSLSRAGWRVSVAERAAQLRTGGWMLGLSGPGLETICRMGLFERLKGVSCHSREKIFYGRSGREIFRLNFDDLIGDTRYLLLNRTDIVQALYDAVRGEADIRFQTTLANARQYMDRVQVTLSDGDEIEADLLIDASGVRSAMREQFFGADENFLEPLGYQFSAYEAENILGLEEDSAFYLAPRHFAEFYPISPTKLAALHVWPSKNTAQVPASERWALMYKMAERGNETIRKVLDTADKTTIPVLDHLTMARMHSWHCGRILITGDAAHCLTFVSGQGAGMALAAGPILVEALRTHGVDKGLNAYEARLRPAIEKLQAHSRSRTGSLVPGNAASYHLRNTVMYLMRNRKGLFGRFLEAERLATESLYS